MMGKIRYQRQLEVRSRRLRRRPACELMERRLVMSSVYPVTSAADSAADSQVPGTLRWAITQVDQPNGAGTITFNIGGGGMQTIKLLQSLPAITNPVVIDGESQPNYLSSPLIQIDGSGLVGPGQSGLVLTAGSNTIDGLSIVGFSGSGVVLNATGNGSQVVASYIGFSAASVQAVPNGTGISISGSSNNTIGGSTQASANVISGNTGNGVLINAGSGNDVYGNLIGTNPAGVVAVGNGQNGIDVVSASATGIGLPVAGSGNVISGNAGAGIELLSGATGTVIQNNEIGLASDAQSALGNGGDGIYLSDSPGNQIGGTDQLQGNLISSNHGNGINAQGNAADTLVEGNEIGTDVSGTLRLGNKDNGIVLGSSSNTIGGTVAGASNTIDFNGSGEPGSGVQLVGSPVCNQILSNSIYENANLGINLGNGPTNNHQPGTPGPNNYQNYPVLLSALSDGKTTTVQGTLYSLPNTNYLIQFFASPSESASGFGQGQTLIGSYVATTNSRGLASFLYPIISETTANQCISATATDPSGDTSEFALDVVSQGQINPVNAADLSVQLAADQSSILVGSELTFTITAANSGPQIAQNASVSLPISAGEAFVSSNAPGGATYANGQVFVALGNMAVGANVSVQVVVEALAAGTWSTAATISSDTVDPNPVNNISTTITTLVNAASHLQISVASSVNPVILGSDFDYIVTVTNGGPSDAGDVVFGDTLPSTVQYVLASSDQDVTPLYDASTGVVTLSLPTLTAGATATLTIEVSPQPAAAPSLTDSASITNQDDTDPDPGHNSVTLVTPVMGVSDLGITATSQTAPAYVGQNIQYVLSVSNQGPNVEPDAVVSWAVPGDANFFSDTCAQGAGVSTAPGFVYVDVGQIGSGQAVGLTFVITPLAGAAGQFTTTFSVQGENLDPFPLNNVASASVQVTPASDLAVAINPGPGGPSDGANWTYTVSVKNLGLSDATGVTVSSVVPDFVSAKSSQGSSTPVQNGVLETSLGAIPAGQSATVTIVILPTSLDSINLSASVVGDQYDPATANNQASLTVSPVPSANLTVSVVPQSTSVMSGQRWSFTASVLNTGPDKATNVALSIPLASGLVFASATPNQEVTISPSGTPVVALGEIDPGSTASVTIVVTTTTAGTFIETASASSAENQLNPDGLSASTSVNVIESPGILQFAASTYTVTENAGVAQLIVSRTDGARGLVTVDYQTVSAGATPGLDYVATSGTLSIPDGQTTGTIQVPVLPDPWDNHDEYVNVVLSSPAGGATIGPLGTSLLRIIDVDPDTTAPEVSSLTWTGTSRSITSLQVGFSEPLEEAYAMNQNNYQLVAPGLGNRVIPLTPESYNGSSYTVTLTPSVVLPSGQYYYIQIVGSGPSAIRDIAGNLLDGAGNGQAGSSYQASFAQGTQLKYVDASGNKVSLKLAGAGYMEQVRDYSGEGVLLDLVGIKPHKSTLSGTVKAPVSRAVRKNKPARSTELGSIQGLGNFGDVKVLLTSPPFYVTSYPFQRHGKGVL